MVFSVFGCMIIKSVSYFITRRYHMEKIIHLLSDIEEKSKNILDNALEEKEKLHLKFEESLHNLDNQILEDMNSKIKQIQDHMNHSLEDEQKKLEDNCNIQLKNLEDNFSNNHDALVEKAFQQIIGV